MKLITLEGMRMTFDEAQEILRCENSYSRLGVILDLGLAGAMEWDDWLRLLGEWWSCCDNISEHIDLLKVLLLDTPSPLYPLMTEEELAAYSALPEEVTVYRGCSATGKHGVSWSLSREVATRFPLLMRYRAQTPMLYTATVHKSKIVAIKLDRNEQEVITFDAKIFESRRLARVGGSRRAKLGGAA